MKQSIYVISSRPGMTKVGIAVDPASRLKELQRASGDTLTLVRAWPLPHGFNNWIERHAHTALADYRTHGEWFACDVDTAISAVESAFAADRPEVRTSGPQRRATNSKGEDVVSINVKHFRSKTWEAAKIAAAQKRMTMGEFISMVIDWRVDLESKGNWPPVKPGPLIEGPEA